MEPTEQLNIVSEGVSSETPRKKTNASTIVLGLTTVLFAGVAAFFGVQYFTNSGQDQGNTKESSQSEDSSQSKSNALSMAEEYKEVKSVMEQIVSGVVDSKYAYGIRSGSGLAVKLDGINTFVQTRFNLYTEIRNDNSNEQNETLLKQNLSEAGFTAIGILPHSGSAGPIINGYKNSDNIVCGFYSDTNWVSENYSYDFTSLSCGKPNWAWLTGEEQTLISQLETAVFNKTGNYPTILLSYPGIIKDSGYSPYQTIWVNAGGAAGLFYRTAPDAEWQYFTATQGLLACEDYNTDDLKRAYLGEPCFYLSDGTNSTVQL